jgi:nitrite reductase (NO-forming)
MEMQKTYTDTRDLTLWIVAAKAAVRAAFGLIWAIDAFLTWRPEFAAHYVGYLQNAAQGQPQWLLPWFNAWIAVVTPAAGVFIWLTRILETLIAIGLLFGLARKWVYIIGGLFSLLLWATAEGFGGPYTTGASNLGPALVYVLLFAALLLFERLIGRNPYSVDYYLERRFPGWTRVAEWAPTSLLEHTPPRLSWPVQGAAISIILLAALFFFGTLRSALGASPATPKNASAAVTPLQLKSKDPIPQAYDPRLPPLAGEGDSVTVNLTSTDANIDIASGVQYQAWTFNGSVPAPIIHVRQGQTVNINYTNKGTMQHSIDFHSAEIDPGANYRSIGPGETIQYSFVANVPGIFIYHCGTPPVLQHIANGMYGAIVVDPADNSLPPADVSYVIVQSEWYTQQVKGNLMTGNFDKMLAVSPDEVVFNGAAFQYKDHPLTAKAGQRVRIYFLDAGPNLTSSFHVIGEIFDAVYPGGDMSQAVSGVSTYLVGAGQGVIFDVTFNQPGDYVIVDHSMRSAFLGAQGIIKVTP